MRWIKINYIQYLADYQGMIIIEEIHSKKSGNSKRILYDICCEIFAD